MQELQRAGLLDAMGLKVFQPRFQLVRAKASMALEPSQQAEVVDSSSSLEGAMTGAATVVEQANQMLQQQQIQSVTGQLTTSVKPHVEQSKNHDNVDVLTRPSSAALLVEGRKRVSDSVVEAKLHNGVDSAVQSIRFRHRVVRVGDMLMIVDQPALQWGDEKKNCAFFNDIYFSLHKKLPEYWQQSVFEWPPSKNFPMANDRDMASATLNGFLKEHMQQPECHSIVCWGEAVSRHFIDESVAVGEIARFGSIPVLVVDEVQQYWLEPSRKQVLWQALLTLKNAFDNPEDNTLT